MSDSDSNKPIRVLHVIGSLGLGGAQVYLKSLVENMDSNRVETWVYPLRPGPRDISIKGEVIEVNYRNYDLRKFFTLLRLCRKHQIDILHAHLHKPIIGCLLASFFCKVRVVVHEHGPIFRKGIQFSLYRLLLCLLRRKADLFIAVSNATSERLVKKAHVSSDKIIVLYNPVDPAQFDPDHILREQTRKQLQIAPDDIVLGFVGRLHPIKGVDILIDAMALLLKKSPHYFLLIIGDGPQRSRLEAQAQRLAIHDRIRFVGFQKNIPQLIGTFDIAVVPSRQEAFGIVAIELMQSKIPLVCSVVEGLKELAIHEETALIPPENKPAPLCQTIEQLRQNDSLRQHLVDSAYRFSRNFLIESYVENIHKIYDQLLNEGSTL